eukprot:scaffold351_cov248-Pinguiococcus_pyrenoidosus.AAC.14
MSVKGAGAERWMRPLKHVSEETAFVRALFMYQSKTAMSRMSHKAWIVYTSTFRPFTITSLLQADGISLSSSCPPGKCGLVRKILQAFPHDTHVPLPPERNPSGTFSGLVSTALVGRFLPCSDTAQASPEEGARSSASRGPPCASKGRETFRSHLTSRFFILLSISISCAFSWSMASCPSDRARRMLNPVLMSSPSSAFRSTLFVSEFNAVLTARALASMSFCDNASFDSATGGAGLRMPSMGSSFVLEAAFKKSILRTAPVVSGRPSWLSL